MTASYKLLSLILRGDVVLSILWNVSKKKVDLFSVVCSLMSLTVRFHNKNLLQFILTSLYNFLKAYIDLALFNICLISTVK